MTATAAKVVEAARSWVGTPYVHQGRSRAGVDCIGLVIVSAWDAGAVPPTFDRRAYPRLPMRDELLGHIRQHCSPADEAGPGVMAVIQWTKHAAHVGLLTGETIIHAYQSVGAVTEHGYRGRWVRMTHSLWYLPGVDYE